MLKRMISLIMCVVIVIGMVPPMAVNAEETEPTQAVTEATEETTAPTESTPEETTAPTEEATEETTVPVEDAAEVTEETTAPTEASTEPTAKPMLEAIVSVDNSFMSAEVQQETNITDENSFSYTLYMMENITVASITRYNGADTNVVIPSTINGYPVKIIDAQAFSNNTEIVSVKVSYGVTEIRSHAFYGCSNLTELDLPDGVTTIGSNALYGTKITRLDLPDSITSIDLSGLSAQLTYIRWTAGIPVVSNTQLYNFRALETVILPEGVTKLADNGYGNPYGCFKDCTSLTSITLPRSLTYIGSAAFMNCSILPEIILPEKLEYIGGSAFYGCSSLTELEFPNGLKTVGSDALCGTMITRLELPDSITSIDLNDLSSQLTYIRWTAGIPVVGNTQFYNFRALETVFLPEGVTELADNGYGNPYGCFKDCTSLTSITLPQSLTKIGSAAFMNCSMLPEISLPEKLQSIGGSAFYGCSSLTELEFPNGLKTVGSDALCGTMITRLELPDSITSIDLNDLSSQLTYIRWTAGIPVVGNTQFYNFRALETVILPEGVTKLEDNGYGNPYGCFRNCTSLTSITLPRSLTQVGSAAFSNCSALSDVYYTGSEQQWASLLSTTDIANNPPLFSSALKVHCNWIIQSEEPESVLDIRYYSGWNEKEQRVYFSADDVTGALVTEETADEFRKDPTNYRETYVTVQTKMEGDQEILLSMTGLTTEYGKVSAVSNAGITLDISMLRKTEHRVFRCNLGVDPLTEYLDKHVLCFLLNNQVVGIRVLQSQIGVLSYFNDSDWLFEITPDGANKSVTLITPSWMWGTALYNRNEATIDLLKLATDETLHYKMSARMNYYADENNLLYEINFEFDGRENGFSEDLHGWSIINNASSFGYTKPYYIDQLVYYAYGDSRWKVNLRVEEWEWSGNCFGLSLLAVAQYLEKIDLRSYFDLSGDTLNGFGYNSIANTQNGDIFTLYYWDSDGRFTQNELVLRLIEKAQVAQFSDALQNDSVLIEYEAQDIPSLISYLNGVNPNPLLITMLGKVAHTVVTDTTKKPISLGNGRYLIPLYDSNIPQSPVQTDTLASEYYICQSMLYLDTQEEKWAYIKNGVIDTYNNGNSEHIYSFDNDQIVSWDISKLDQSFFDEHYKFEIDQDKTTIIFSGEEVEIILDPGDGTKTTVFEFIDEPSISAGNVTFISYSGELETSEVKQGCVILPKGNYVVKTKGESYVQYMYDDEIFVYSSDQPTEAEVDAGKDELTVWSSDTESNVQCVYASAKVDFCTAVDAKLSSRKSASLRTNSKNKTASVSTNAGAGSVTVTQVVDGEEIENTSDMIHYHKDLSFVEGFDATCTQPGQVSHYVCECGKSFIDDAGYEEIRTVALPALGHAGEWMSTENPWEEIRFCSRCGNEERRIVENCLVMDPAVLGDHASVWIEGAEYPVVNNNGQSLIVLPEGDSFYMTTYTFHDKESSDVHTRYPISMKVWYVQIGEDNQYGAVHIQELDNILQYSGASIRVTGKQGIRMITSMEQTKKNALTSDGLAGYTLKEYGTMVAWASQINADKPLVLGKPYAKSNYAYKQGVADPIFAYKDGKMQYTNVLVNFSDEQCKKDIAMRPYMILTDGENDITLYGGIVERSIGYIAYQNRAAFTPGTDAYKYVWDIIHSVYGDAYDAEYVA